MKTSLYPILTFLLLSITTSSHCQDEIQKPKFEISYGLSINDVYDHVDEREFQKRFSASVIGLTIHSYISENSSFKADLEYSHKGPLNYNINYLTFSPLYNHQFLNKSVYLELGPYFGSMFQYRGVGRAIKHKDLQSFDIGTQLGFGKNFCINGVVFNLSYQAEIGLIRFSFSKHFVQQIKIGFYL